MNVENLRIAVLAAVLWAVLAPTGAARGDVQLTQRYRDPINGFSLRPPAGCEMKRQPSASKIVTWAKRDPQTDAIEWTFTAQRAVRDGEKLKMKAFRDGLVRKLAREENFKPESAKLAPVAGKPAVHVRGVTGGSVRLWQKQVWILASSKRLLIFTISGPVDRKAQLEKVSRRVVATVEITDPDRFIQGRRKHLYRGEDLLASLDARTVTGAIVKEPQWFLMTLNDKAVGWMRQVESVGRREGKEGIRVRTWAKARIPDSPRTLMGKTAFVTPDRHLERWREIVQRGSGEQATARSEEGLKVGDRIVVDIRTKQRSATVKKRAPMEFYLPRAMGLILPRLLDLSREGTYAFATYNGSKNDFDMRTVTVGGVETLGSGSGKTRAVRLKDQQHYDQETTTVWVSPKGRLLRMESPQGFVLEARGKDAVLRRYPQAERTIWQMDRAAKKGG